MLILLTKTHISHQLNYFGIWNEKGNIKADDHGHGYYAGTDA